MDLPPLQPIGYISSCYKEKFGIPRQAGLHKADATVIVLPRTTAMLQATEGLEAFSHLWVIFYFHALKRSQWRPRVRPPRLGGDKTVGVFASRSPYRPVPLGLSAVALERVAVDRNSINIQVTGGDFLDGTPVLDIKPYLPYSDAIPTANGAWAAMAPPCLPVIFTPHAHAQLASQSTGEERQHLQELITATLAFDPRPSYHRRLHPLGLGGKEWKVRLGDCDITWLIADGIITVTNILYL